MIRKCVCVWNGLIHSFLILPLDTYLSKPFIFVNISMGSHRNRCVHVCVCLYLLIVPAELEMAPQTHPKKFAFFESVCGALALEKK